MTQVEFSQQIALTWNDAVPVYAILQAAPATGVYIVKGLSVSTNVDMVSAGGYSLAMISATSTGGGGEKWLYSTATTVTANTSLTIFTPATQVILNQPYLGFQARGAGPGTLTINVSYIFIPTGTLTGKFSYQYSTVTGNTTGASFVGASAPKIVKSIVITNPTATGSVDVTPLLTTTGGLTSWPFADTVTIPAGSQYVYSLPIYLSSNQTITIQNVGTPSVNVLYSYTQDSA